jgi:hypothetical protein
MKTIFEHIENVKSKPHHIRKMVAFSAAAVGTAVVALVWLIGSLSTSAFALKNTSFVQIASDETDSSPADVNDEQLAGIGAASVLENKSDPARIEIIDIATTTTSKRQTEQTTIPF